MAILLLSCMQVHLSRFKMLQMLLLVFPLSVKRGKLKKGLEILNIFDTKINLTPQLGFFFATDFRINESSVQLVCH